MDDMIIERMNEGLAHILEQRQVGETTRVATVYRMTDGWHSKLAAEHTRHAWSGPFTTPEAALAAISSDRLERPS